MAGAASTHHLVTFQLYAALAAARLVPGASALQREQLLARIDASIEQFEAWNAAGPANFAHRLLLLRAARADALGDATSADMYDAAHATARASGYVNDAALAAELAGRFDVARDAYARWGATAKVEELASLTSTSRDRP